MYTLLAQQYGLKFPRGFGKIVSEGLCALASFDLLWGFLMSKANISQFGEEGGVSTFILFSSFFFVGVQILLNSCTGGDF